MIEKESIFIKSITFHIGLPKTGTTSLQDICKTISDHVNLGSHYFEVDYANKIPEIKRNGDFFIKLFYDRDQIYLEYLKEEENLEKKFMESLEVFKSSRYHNAFVSSEFLIGISIDAWQNIIYLLKQNNIQIAKLILVLRNPQKRFFSSLFNKIRDRKYNNRTLSEAYSVFMKQELTIYKKIDALNKLFGNQLSIIDYDSNQEALLDKIFDEANLKKGFPYNRIKTKQKNKNKFLDYHHTLIIAILDNRLINFLHRLIIKVRLESFLRNVIQKKSLLQLLNDLPVHQNKKFSLQLDCESTKLIEKVNKEYSRYTQQNNIEDNTVRSSIATLKIKYFFRYLLILILIKSRLQK